MRNDKAMRRLLAKANAEMFSIAYKGAFGDTPTLRLARMLKNTALKYVGSEKYSSYIGDKPYERQAYRQVTEDNHLGLLLFAYTAYLTFFKRLKKVVFSQNNEEMKAKMAFLLVKKNKPYEKVRIEYGKKLTEIDYGAKKILIDDALKNGLFFLVSKHDDCAKDHEEYQGKIYVNENWRSMTKDPMVAMYISTNRIRTFQWVTGKPVYMITRPYCRHYFREVSASEVLSNSVNALLNKHHMHEKEGERGVSQTLPNRMAELYLDRLDYLSEMYKVAPCEELQNYINKTVFLMHKWRNK